MGKSFDTQALNTAMIGAVTESIKKILKDEFSSPPSAETKPLFFNDYGNMQASGLRKFHGRSYISVIYFYLSEKQAEKNEVCGTLVLYVRDSVALPLSKVIGRGGQSEKTPQDNLANVSGELCNTFAASFKSGLSNLGYKDLLTSAPENHMDMVPQGVKVFDKGQKNCQEFSFYLWDAKAIALDVVMADVPRR